jgi:hypothetical protein
VNAIEVSLTTSDVVAFVKVPSIDCGVTVIVHLGLSVLMLALPPAGISTVPMVEPLASGPVLAWRSHGAVEDALVVTVTLPPMLDVQFLKSSWVMLARVCVAGTYPTVVEFLQEIVTITPNGAVAENLESVEEPVTVDLAVSPIGVMKGETGLLPVEVVKFGVAKAGAATTTSATTRTSAASTPVLNSFI